MKKINWLNHGIELMVVIIGISIAFMLNNWRDSRKAREQEREYLENILEDLEDDIYQFNFVMGMDSVKKRQLDSLVGFTFMPLEAVPDAEVVQYLFNNNYYIPFEAQGTTYDVMTATGGLSLIKDDEVRQQIVQLYTRRYAGITILDEALQDHVQDFTVQYFVYNVQFLGYNKIDKSVLKRFEFRNIIIGQQGLLDRRMKFYVEALENTEHVKSVIEDYL